MLFADGGRAASRAFCDRRQSNRPAATGATEVTLLPGPVPRSVDKMPPSTRAPCRRSAAGAEDRGRLGDHGRCQVDTFTGHPRLAICTPDAIAWIHIFHESARRSESEGSGTFAFLEHVGHFSGTVAQRLRIGAAVRTPCTWLRKGRHDRCRVGEARGGSERHVVGRQGK